MDLLDHRAALAERRLGEQLLELTARRCGHARARETLEGVGAREIRDQAGDRTGREAVRAVAETDVHTGETAEGSGLLGAARRDADPAVAASIDAPAGAGPAVVASADLAVGRLRRLRYVAGPEEAHVHALSAPGPLARQQRRDGRERAEHPGRVVRVCDHVEDRVVGAALRRHETRARLEDRVEARERGEWP